MNILLQKVGRRYNQEWIFRNLDYAFEPSKKYAILGPNGTGKSTLLKVLTGSLTTSEGKLSYSNGNKTVSVEQFFKNFSFAAPYTELIEEFSLSEMIDFHFKFKSFFNDFNKQKIIEFLDLKVSLNKPLKQYSSGMKQRVKLALACFSESSVVFLDEPTSNLDNSGEQWYLNLIENTFQSKRTLIIGSNQPHEYAFCDETLNILDYKFF